MFNVEKVSSSKLKMLKVCSLLAIITVILTMLGGCGGSKNSGTKATKTDKQVEEYTKDSKDDKNTGNQVKEFVCGVDRLGKFKGAIGSNVGFAVCGIDEKKVLGQERPQGKFVIVKVAMFNGMKRPMTMSETEFKLVTTDGAEYAYSIRAIPDVNGGRRGGDHKEINPGFTVFKSFPFDVPKNINISDLRLKAVGEHNGVPVLLPLVVQKVG